MERLDREPRPDDAPQEARPLLRILRLLKPYAGLILLVVLCTNAADEELVGLDGLQLGVSPVAAPT